MRILFTGASPWINSGYGKPLRYLLPRLVRAGYECALAPFFGYQGPVTTTRVGGEEIRIYPLARDRFFNDIIEYHAESFGADVVISLQDAWVLKDWGQRGFRWLPWLPIDCAPVSMPVLRAIEGCYAPLSYSQWGREQLIDAGWPQAKYVPFGVDLDVYKPLVGSLARETMSLPAEGFIAGVVAANSSYPSRKSFPEILQAWKSWADGGGQGTLYLHTTLSPKRGAGIDFPKLLDTLDLDWSTLDDPNEWRKREATVVFPSQHRMWCYAYDDTTLALLYNCFDVLLSPSMGEGFGIPLLEAQACGVPVVTNRTTSMPELTFSGICLEPAQPYWEEQGGWRGIADIDEIEKAIQWAYDIRRAETGHEHYAKKAHAKAQGFGWDGIVEQYWLPLLEELADAQESA